jgi:hypothetical protein
VTTTVEAVAGEALDLVLATSPSQAAVVVQLTSLHGVDGIDVGTDALGEALVFPVTMVEGADGVYSTEVVLAESGPYWARFTVDAVAYAPTIIRVVPSGSEPAEVDSEYIAAYVHSAVVASMQLTVSDLQGELAGVDDTGTAIAWPEAMTAVAGYTDEWYYQSVTFTEGGRYALTFTPIAGSIVNEQLQVHEDPAAASYGQFSGWEPSEALDPGAWVSLSYIRRWTGWSSATIDAETLRELRRLAIQTWIEETGCWVAPWAGTFHQLSGQGTRLYLPVPLILPSQGGATPTVVIADREGDSDEVDTLDNGDLSWRVRGPDAKQPFVEYTYSSWDPWYDVRITGTWGVIGVDTAVPGSVKQAIVGLMRWHSLSYGKDGEEAREQNLLHRTADEGTRDSRIAYHPSSVGRGITGDRMVDSVIAKYKITPGPWAVRCGPLTGD